ncbi:MAG: hypothetical protein LUM44_23825 [Pyrinomonadaceae bacterium]|nr:hypothetical protein [Pyrinomonadaceae bacterium]
MAEKAKKFAATGAEIYHGNLSEDRKEHHLFNLKFIQVWSFSENETDTFYFCFDLICGW